MLKKLQGTAISSLPAYASPNRSKGPILRPYFYSKGDWCLIVFGLVPWLINTGLNFYRTTAIITNISYISFENDLYIWMTCSALSVVIALYALIKRKWLVILVLLAFNLLQGFIGRYVIHPLNNQYTHYLLIKKIEDQKDFLNKCKNESILVLNGRANVCSYKDSGRNQYSIIYDTTGQALLPPEQQDKAWVEAVHENREGQTGYRIIPIRDNFYFRVRGF